MRDTLIQAAKDVRMRAYTPYSHFKVGAALLTVSGKLYTGCNIENSSYSLTCCAERVAIFKAISEGENTFEAMAVTGSGKQVIRPCGACRQVMGEFFKADMPIYLTNLDGQITSTTISDLLPNAFHL